MVAMQTIVSKSELKEDLKSLAVGNNGRGGPATGGKTSDSQSAGSHRRVYDAEQFLHFGRFAPIILYRRSPPFSYGFTALFPVSLRLSV